MTSGTLLFNNATDVFGNTHVLFDDKTPDSVPQRFATVDYQRFGGSLGAGRDFSVSTQLWAHYRLERINANVPLAASDVRGRGAGAETEPIDFSIVRGASILSTMARRCNTTRGTSPSSRRAAGLRPWRPK